MQSENQGGITRKQADVGYCGNQDSYTCLIISSQKERYLKLKNAENFKKYSRNQIFKQINQDSKKLIQEGLGNQKEEKNLIKLIKNQEKNAKD